MRGQAMEEETFNTALEAAEEVPLQEVGKMQDPTTRKIKLICVIKMSDIIINKRQMPKAKILPSIIFNILRGI